MSTASDLQALQNDIDAAVKSTRRRNIISFVLSLVALCLVGYWLYYAHNKFVTVNPDFAADYLQSQANDYLPQAGTDLEASLKSYAPQFVDEAQSRLEAIPDRFASEIENHTKQELDAAAPKIEDELYKSMKSAMADAKTNAKGGDDSARFKSMLDAMADTYRDESVKLVDQIHDTYTANGSDIVSYVKILGDNKNLDRRQQLHRDMLQQFLVVAHQQAKPDVLPVAK